MKYLLMIAFVVVVMIVAQGVCRQYRERCVLFESVNDFFRQMQLNLAFQKQKIKEILEKTTIKKNNREIYTIYLEYLNSGKAIDLTSIKILDDTEQEQISSMLLSLGKSNAESEIKQLEVYEKYLQDKIQSSKQEKEKYCPLITKLSFLFSVGLVILFI